MVSSSTDKAANDPLSRIRREHPHRHIVRRVVVPRVRGRGQTHREGRRNPVFIRITQRTADIKSALVRQIQVRQ